MSPKDEAATMAVDDHAVKKASDRAEIASMKKLLLDTKVGKQSVWSMTLETFGMADGKHKKDDILVDTVADGLELLNAYIEDKESHHSASLKKDDGKSSGGPAKLMDVVPLAEFNATQDQFLTAFLKWTEKKGDKDDNSESSKINVSKARRRLDAYFGWMLENPVVYEEALTLASISAAAKLWDIQITYDNDGHFVWWVDLGALDREEIKKVPVNDHLRYVVWFSHLVIFDEKAQNNGVYIVEDMGMMGFFKMATLVPADMGAKMDRLTIGILPVRVKSIYVFGAARWMSLLMALMRPFMGKKMSQRLVIMPRKTDMQTFCDDLVTRENIPVDFCGLQGEAARDAVVDRFKK